MVKPKNPDRAQLDRMEARLDRLVQGLTWFMDGEGTPTGKELGRPMTSPPATPERRIELRPRAYTAGWNTFFEKGTRESNPYKSTRGGYQNAWLHGFDDAESGLDRRPKKP